MEEQSPGNYDYMKHFITVKSSSAFRVSESFFASPRSALQNNAIEEFDTD